MYGNTKDYRYRRRGGTFRCPSERLSKPILIHIEKGTFSQESRRPNTTEEISFARLTSNREYIFLPIHTI